MGIEAYERLSSQDCSYLKFEAAGTPCHVTAIAVFDGAPFVAPGGVLDMECARAHIASRLHLLPRYRQRLAYTPIQGHPIWVDDAEFDLRYHVRHVALPRPGGRPLWELWFLEGIEEGRFAVVAKVHHCMVDGVSGVGVLTALLSGDSEARLEPERPWQPRPAPGAVRFLSDGVGGLAGFSTSLLREAGGAVRSPGDTVSRLADGVSAAWDTLRAGFTPPPDLPINRPIGAQRRTDWRVLDFQAIVDMRKRLDGSLNDVVLSVVAGAGRRLLKRRRVRLKGLDLRVIVPVDRRNGAVDMSVGNRVSAWFVSLPVGESSPLRRFERIRTQTRALKRRDTARGIEGFWRFADWTGSTRLTFLGASLVSFVQPYNLIVTNVHGPQFPLYLLGARLHRLHAQVPLFENQGLAVAAMSYLGKLSFGLQGDWNLLRDLDCLAESIDDSFDELRGAADRRR
jgi:WS/DGAT/MGAT family acyltransferase